MKVLVGDIDRVVRQLATQQAIRDPWWEPELASIMERLGDVCLERGDRQAAMAALPASIRDDVADAHRFAREKRERNGAEAIMAGATVAGATVAIENVER
jgi:hypothetical protein